jgi:hypothetical protein
MAGDFLPFSLGRRWSPLGDRMRANHGVQGFTLIRLPPAATFPQGGREQSLSRHHLTRITTTRTPPVHFDHLALWYEMQALRHTGHGFRHCI